MNLEHYWKDAKGHLVPIESIKEIDKLRDQLVRTIVEEIREQHELLKQLKNKLFDDVAAFVDLSAEQYDVKVGGKKGNITLFSFDAEYKLQYAIAEHLQFDERIQTAKLLIDECLQEWTEGARVELKTLIDRAFDVDKEGNLNTARILALRRVKIDDVRWLKAMDAISDSIQVIGSKPYIRAYKRLENGSYQQISLDFASV